MSKTLGQVAFEAYRDEIRKDKTLWCDDWADLPEHAYSHWQAAAEAVRYEVVSRAALNEQMYYSPMSPIRDEERAIIEAARRHNKERLVEVSLLNLSLALEALDSEEGDG